MKEMLGYQVDEVAASLKMSSSFDPTTLIEIAVYISIAPNARTCMIWSIGLLASQFGNADDF